MVKIRLNETDNDKSINDVGGSPLPQNLYPSKEQLADTGYVIPQELKNHKNLPVGTFDPRLSNEFAPFDFRTSPTTGPLAIKNTILAGRIVRARLSGMSYSQISTNFGISESQAQQLVTSALKKSFPEEDVDTLRALANAQYDKIIEAWYSPATDQQDDRAAKILLAAIAEKRKMNAVDEQPVKKTQTETTIQVSLTEAATDVLERYGSEFIEAEIVDEGRPETPKELQISYNPAVLALLDKNREANNLMGDQGEPLLIDEKFLEELDSDEADLDADEEE